VVDEAALRRRIKELMVERLRLEGVDPNDIDDERPFDWIGLDSVDALELVVALEKEFDIKVRNEDLKKESFASVAALASMIRTYLA
jgi:acyl carrier protein